MRSSKKHTKLVRPAKRKTKSRRTEPAKKESRKQARRRSPLPHRYVGTTIKKKRSDAARKGWRTRRRNQQQGRVIRTGYDSHTPGNSYALTVQIRPHKRLSDSQCAELIEKLVSQGHFDAQAQEMPEAPSTLNWATFHNSSIVIERGVRMKKGTAVLIYFERSAP